MNAPFDRIPSELLRIPDPGRRPAGPDEMTVDQKLVAAAVLILTARGQITPVVTEHEIADGLGWTPRAVERAIHGTTTRLGKRRPGLAENGWVVAGPGLHLRRPILPTERLLAIRDLPAVWERGGS